MKRDQETLSSDKTYRLGGVEFERQDEDYLQKDNHTGRGSRGYRRSDKTIYEDVCEALAMDAEVDASGIEVSVTDGVVNFTGVVPSRKMKRLAEEIAEEILGVVDIRDEIVIDDSDKLSVYSGM
jgi:osmotically-inducible protein OsmY